jgi:hypothetical protein
MQVNIDLNIIGKDSLNKLISNGVEVHSRVEGMEITSHPNAPKKHSI